MIATSKLYKFSPLTPAIPNALNSQPPTTAPTMPSTMSINIPSPVLLTSLLAMKPATNPSTIQAMNDILSSPCWLYHRELLQDRTRLRGTGPPRNENPPSPAVAVNRPCPQAPRSQTSRG